MTGNDPELKGELTHLIFGAIKASPEMLDYCLDIATPKIRWMILQQANAVRPLRGFRLTQDMVDKPQVHKFLYGTFHRGGLASAFIRQCVIMPASDTGVNKVSHPSGR